jgi:hypothetical protein
MRSRLPERSSPVKANDGSKPSDDKIKNTITEQLALNRKNVIFLESLRDYILVPLVERCKEAGLEKKIASNCISPVDSIIKELRELQQAWTDCGMNVTLFSRGLMQRMPFLLTAATEYELGLNAANFYVESIPDKKTYTDFIRVHTLYVC